MNRLFNLLTQRHVVVALLVTPLLAIGAWYLTGQFVAEDALTPQPAEAGLSYPLMARSGCRYAGGRCVLANGDLELAVTLANENEVTVSTSAVAERVLVAAQILGEPAPQPLIAERGASPGEWRARVNLAGDGGEQLLIAVEVGGALFYGEAPLTFTTTPDG
jgi:hypothetical protein